MTIPHEDVVIDLLPLYFTGDASDASRTLVDAYFAAHPDFARTMRAAHLSRPVLPATVGAQGDKIALKRIRTRLRWRYGLMSVAIFCSLVPLSFIYDKGEFRFLMVRDATATAMVYIAVAAILWVAVYILGRRTATGEGA